VSAPGKVREGGALAHGTIRSHSCSSLDQQASARRAQETLGWQPRRPDVLENIERGSYAKR